MAAKKSSTKQTTETKQAPAKKGPVKKGSANKDSAKATSATKPTAKKTPPPKRAKKMSALAAAAKVLAETKEPMTGKALIEAMAANGYWTSPGGQTPHATLYAAITREIAKKGSESRFQKTDRGLFAAKS